LPETQILRSDARIKGFLFVAIAAAQQLANAPISDFWQKANVP
jgi:hypothetical protein